MTRIISKTAISDFRDLVNWYLTSLTTAKYKAAELAMANPSEREIDTAVDFAINNVGYFLDFLPDKNPAYLTGKTILEIGPGQDFGIPLVLMGFGVSKAVLIDRFFCEWDEKFHPEYYRRLLKKAETRYPGIEFEDLKNVIKNNRHTAERLQLLAAGLENVAAIPDASVDISYSNACFEHLADAPVAIKELGRITKQGGLGFHQIDFRDHRNFEKPLEFLAMPDWIFKRTFVLSKHFLGNRYRSSHFARFFGESGFQHSFSPELFAEPAYLDDILNRANPEFRKMPMDAIRVLAGRFFLEKK